MISTFFLAALVTAAVLAVTGLALFLEATLNEREPLTQARDKQDRRLVFSSTCFTFVGLILKMTLSVGVVYLIIT